MTALHGRRPLPVALQLYTLRAAAAADLLGTLDAVAALGYEGVELAGLHGVEPAAVRARCDALGLAICAAHVAVERFEHEEVVVGAELLALGCDTIVFPSLPDGEQGLAVARVAGAARAARAAGLAAAFHNHADELRRGPDGTRAWEALVAVEGLGLELDLGWAWVAGADPASLLRSVAGRVPLVHVKDHLADGADCPVGDGEVGYGALLPEIVAAGARWLVVEQDEPGADPLAACARSLAGLRAMDAPAPAAA